MNASIGSAFVPDKKRGFRKRSVLRELRSNRMYYSMAVPGLLFMVFFSYVPYYFLLAAFKDFNLKDGLLASPWVGLKNFRYFFVSGDAFHITANTIILNAYFIISGIVAQVGLAILINEAQRKWFRKTAQTIFFFPYFLSWVIVGEIVYNILSSDYGILNKFLTDIGLSKIYFYQHPEYWRSILVIANIWKYTGYGTLVYLATMAGFDASLYEAAEVDGASKLQRIVHLTVPMLKPTVVILFLFSVGKIFFSDFTMILATAYGPTKDYIKVIDYYVYYTFKINGVNGLGTSVAIGLYQSVFGLIVITLTNKAAKRFNDGSALF
jgi:putative aldouronate transport system permease protein